MPIAATWISWLFPPGEGKLWLKDFRSSLHAQTNPAKLRKWRRWMIITSPAALCLHWFVWFKLKGRQLATRSHNKQNDEQP